MSTKKRKIGLDTDENELLQSFDKGEWKTVGNLEEEREVARQAATHFMRKDARINIRVSSYDLDRIKRIAANEGLSYQTLIASVLHKFAAARIAG